MSQPEQIKCAQRSEQDDLAPSVMEAGSVVLIFILASLPPVYLLKL